MEWQPIETAPIKCGVRMLLTGRYEGQDWIEIGMRSRIDGRWIMSSGMTLLGITHWIPLPDLPKE